MNRFTEMLKNHIWCVIGFASLLFLWILTIRFGEDASLVSHLGLAASVLSIALAIIVIVYTFYQTERSGQNLTEMRTLIYEASSVITSKADTIAQKASDLQDALATLQPPKKLNDQQNKDETFETRLVTDQNLSAYTEAGLVLLYCLLKAYEKNKVVHITKFSWSLAKLKTDATSYMLIGYCVGVIQSLQSFWPGGSLAYIRKTNLVTVLKLPENFSSELTKELEYQIKKESNSQLEEYKASADQYIETL